MGKNRLKTGDADEDGFSPIVTRSKEWEKRWRIFGLIPMIGAFTIIFVTPVYWYAMSGRMKVFFDRWTDLLKIDKDTGRHNQEGTHLLSDVSSGAWTPSHHPGTCKSTNYLYRAESYLISHPDNANASLPKDPTAGLGQVQNAKSVLSCPILGSLMVVLSFPIKKNSMDR